MENLGKLSLIIIIGTFLLCSFLFIGNLNHHPNPDEYNHTEKELNISNLTSHIYFEDTSDQYGNIISQHYKYHVYADVYSVDLGMNYTVHIKAYDSEGNYLENISSIKSLSSLNSISEGSGRNINYNYFSDELIDYKYAVFEIYDYEGNLVYNQTVFFDLDNVSSRSSIEYIGGQVW